MKKHSKISLLSCCLSLNFANAAKKPHWSYEGNSGPKNWGSLSQDYKLCPEGNQQSPINIQTQKAATKAPLKFNYSNSVPLEITNNGHTVQVNFKPGNSISMGKKEWELKQLHFHSKSEHTFNNQHSALEMHLVHKNKNGGLAVVGVMFEEGGEDSTLLKMFERIPKENQTKSYPKITLNLNNLLPKNKELYTYKGSLTTPPCSEGVSWFVMKNKKSISLGQLNSFKKYYSGNFRPVQPLNNRKL